MRYKTNHAFSFTVTFTEPLVQHFIIMFVELTPYAVLLNALSVWARRLICCICFYSVYLMRRSLFQFSAVGDFLKSCNRFYNCTRYDRFCFFFMLAVSFLVLLFA